MRSKTRIVNVKLTPTELQAIDDLVKLHRFETRSAVIRAGLGFVFEKFKLSREADRKIEDERRIHRPRRRPAI